MNESNILIFCDGASKGNPGPGGWGALVATSERVEELGGFEKNTTNNRMELRAALEALQKACTLGNGDVVVYTDSSYVINGITKWVAGWQRNGWKTKEKKPVLNQDLWEPLLQAAESFDTTIEWQYVGGHVGVAGNERVDVIASDFATGVKVSLYSGTRSAYTIEIANLGHDEGLQRDKSALKERSKAKAYSYVSKVDGKVMTHKTWAECEARVRGKIARYKKALSAEDEAALIQEFSL